MRLFHMHVGPNMMQNFVLRCIDGGLVIAGLALFGVAASNLWSVVDNVKN